MNYKVSNGIPEADLAKWLTEAGKKYGKFEDGRVNYKDADIAPIVMCTVVCGKEILLVKRGYGLADAEGLWSTVNGFIDEVKPVKDQVKQETNEELGLTLTDDQIKVGDSYTLANPKEKRVYIVFSCLVTLKSKPKIVLDSENTDYKWILRRDLENYEILDDLPLAIDSALKSQ